MALNREIHEDLIGTKFIRIGNGSVTVFCKLQKWCKITYICYGDFEKMIHLELETPYLLAHLVI